MLSIPTSTWYWRADIEDVATAHLLAMGKAVAIGFGRYVVSATTPFNRGDLAALRTDAPTAVRHYALDYEALYAKCGWTMTPAIERVYVNTRARTALEWRPAYDFAGVIRRLRRSGDYRSALARSVGSKGYHDRQFADGPYPTE